MIRFKLQEMMKKNNIEKVFHLVDITKKYHKKGLDWRALVRIRDNKVDRIDIFVIDVLCHALNCSIADLIEHIPSEGGKSPHKSRPFKK